MYDALISSFSGIDVGDQFYSRAEMVVLGIHSHWLNGIDYMGMKYQEKVTSINISIATVIPIIFSSFIPLMVDDNLVSPNSFSVLPHMIIANVEE